MEKLKQFLRSNFNKIVVILMICQTLALLGVFASVLAMVVVDEQPKDQTTQTISVEQVMGQ